MRIGLIDVDNQNKLSDCYPNLAIMKISAYHKANGDVVEWYDLINATIHHMTTGQNYYSKVYMSKVFSFTDDYEHFVFADEIIKGGTGYAFAQINGREAYIHDKDTSLDDEIEHMYPDYELYNIKDKAFGYHTRGCPRGCDFCIVKDKEGRRSYKVADLDEFWKGQKYISLYDPNILACKDWQELLHQLEQSRARVDFNQGLDIRLMTEEKAKALSKIKIDAIHFAWDRIEDKDIIQPKFEVFRHQSKIRQRDLQVYVLVGDREPRLLGDDLYRVYWLRDHGYSPYIMIYEKYKLDAGNDLLRLRRWVNNRFIFWKTERFDDYTG